MKMHGLAAAVVCIAVIGAMWVEWPEPTRRVVTSYAVFCLKKKNKNHKGR